MATRASTSAETSQAPATKQACVAAEKVAPVVITSSTSTTDFPAISALREGGIIIEPSICVNRSSRDIPSVELVLRVRCNRSGQYVSPLIRDTERASSAAWLNRRLTIRVQCKGIGARIASCRSKSRPALTIHCPAPRAIS